MGWFTTSNRLTDTYGFIPPDNYGVALAKNLTYNHQPYEFEKGFIWGYW